MWKTVGQVESGLFPVVPRAKDWEFYTGEECGTKDWGKRLLVVSGASGGVDGEVREAGLRAADVIVGELVTG